jgi:hypothetical protein
MVCAYAHCGFSSDRGKVHVDPIKLILRVLAHPVTYTCKPEAQMIYTYLILPVLSPSLNVENTGNG